ncbi:MAG: DUF4292 domain-containing protein [Siphonobacter sp.]
MNWNLSLLSICLMVVLATGCKRHKLHKSQTVLVQKDSVSTGPPEIPRESKVPAAPVTVQVADIDFKYLVSKAKVSFKSKANSIDNADLNIKVKKDSIIWFNAGQFGITGARGLITRDSVTIVDVLHRSYVTFGYTQLSARFGIELSFDLLQSLLIGNLPFKDSSQKITQEMPYWVIHQNTGDIQIDNYIHDQDRKLHKLKAVQAQTNNTLTLTYDQFTAVNRFLFPYLSSINLQAANETTIELKQKKVELTDQPQTFPFSIPTRYERKN